MKENYFNQVPINIFENKNLREPQIKAYWKAYEHYNSEDYNEKKRETLITLPTGTGKTGVMAILPFGISEKRTLIITPQLTIKKGVLDALTNGPDSFYIKMGLLGADSTPEVAEYVKNNAIGLYETANIIVVNIHKLQGRLPKSVVNVFPPDYFDLIIIDEAHHSTATTWNYAIDYFYEAKIIKLTGTPFRADGKLIKGTEIYKYSLSSAMSNGFVKSLENIEYTPEKLYLRIDNDERLYTIKEILAMKLKDNDWITRSVAYSYECSEQIVKLSVKALKEKRAVSGLPHKIIAVACSVKHAEEIKEIYRAYGCNVAIIHSNLDDKILEKNFSDIENNRVEVVINVAMLGEGYDHPYLSIAAIFRPFRALSAYIQFVGRILRFINKAETPQDNIGKIIAHKELQLEELWNYYKKEMMKSEISNKILELTKKENILTKNDTKEIKVKDTGKVFEEGEGVLKLDTFMETEILKREEERQKKENEDIKKLIEIMGYTEEYARSSYYASKARREGIGLNRPDLRLAYTREALDNKIREEIIPELLLKTGHVLEEKTLDKNKIFMDTKYSWIVKSSENNGALLAKYINSALKYKLGKERREWLMEDYKIALEYLEKLVKFLETSIKPKE